MGLTLDRGRFYFVMDVPNHLFGRALSEAGRPTDLSVAKRKAFELEELKRSEWHMLELGEGAIAHEKFAATKLTAESRGFDYVPSTVFLQKSFQENLPRLLAAAGTASQPTPPDVADAILGSGEVAFPPLRSVIKEYIALTKTKHKRKSDRQRHLWRVPRARNRFELRASRAEVCEGEHRQDIAGRCACL